MRSLLAFVLLSITASAYAQSADAPDTIIAQENAFWKAYVSANTANLSKLLSPEFINVEEQLMNRDQVLAFVGSSISNVRLLPSHFSIPMWSSSAGFILGLRARHEKQGEPHIEKTGITDRASRCL